MNAFSEVTLDDLCRKVTDGTHDSPKLLPDGVPFVKGKHISGGVLDLENCDRISYEDHLKVISRSKPENGDTLFSNIGSVGDSVFVNTDTEFSIKNVALFKPDPYKVMPKYLFYLLRSPKVLEGLLSQRSGSAQPFIGLSTLRQYKVEYHNDLTTQSQVVSILSAYDDLIENNTRRIEILEEMARRLYEEWVVHFCFPGHEEVNFKESELGRIPEGWEVKGLYDIAEVTYGHPFKAKQFNDQGEGLGAVRIRDIRGGEIKTYTTEEGKSKHIIENGDILVGMDGQFHMGKWAGGQAWLVQRVVRFRPTLSLSRYMLFLTIERPIKHLEETIVGTTVAHLSAKDLKAMKIIVPDEARLKMMADTLEPMYELEMKLKRQNVNLRAQRDLLLPKLVSGEIDVSDLPMPDDKEVNAA